MGPWGDAVGLGRHSVCVCVCVCLCVCVCVCVSVYVWSGGILCYAYKA